MKFKEEENEKENVEEKKVRERENIQDIGVIVKELIKISTK